MSEPVEPNDTSKEDATIGMSVDGDVCIMTLPLQKYALDETNGSALIYGKMRELQAHVIQMAGAMRLKRAQSGIIKTPTNLKVN